MPTIKVPAGTDIHGEIPNDEWWNETAKLNEYMLDRSGLIGETVSFHIRRQGQGWEWERTSIEVTDE